MSKNRLSRRDFVGGAAGTTALGFSSMSLGKNAGPKFDGGPISVAPDVRPLLEDYQVIQRNKDDTGACFVKIPDSLQGPSVFNIKVSDETGRIWVDEERNSQDVSHAEKVVVLPNLPVGGPYVIEVLPLGGGKGQGERISFRNVLVGDIWILAGQSNMIGAALPAERLPALPYFNLLNNRMFVSDSHWCAGIPPTSREPDNIAPFDLKDRYPGITDEEIKQQIAAMRPFGRIGPDYFFAKALYEMGSDVPIGVIPCALGAALAEWDPTKRDHNRYGFMYQQVMRAGGRAKGMLWYQGEQDAVYGDEQNTITKPCLVYPLSTYAQEFKKFVEAVRSDFQSPDLVVITTQICRHHFGKKERHKFWERVREIQRTIPDQMPNVHVVPTVDFDVMDGLHLDYWSQKRLGHRMAYVALPHIKKDVTPRTEIKLKSVQFGQTPKSTIVIEFDGVSGKLRAPGRPTGFQLRKKDTGEDLDWIFKVDFASDDPNKLILRVAGMNTTAGLVLIYAPGAVPYVNIVDENDMGIPAFGPIEIT